MLRLEAELRILLERSRREHLAEVLSLEHRLETYKGFSSEPEIHREEDLLRTLRTWRLKGLEHWGYMEPPPFYARYPGLSRLAVMPGTTSDWDFSSANWTLDLTVYVSSPSSLRSTGTVLPLCKYAGTTALNQGRLVYQYRWSSNYTCRPWCRNQRTVGGSDEQNGYRGYFWPNPASTWRVQEVTGGSASDLASGTTYLTGAFSLNTWYGLRWTWWTSGGVLILRFERLNGSWAKVIDDVPDSSPSWEGNPTNRTGIAMSTGAYQDDTEIWGP